MIGYVILIPVCLTITYLSLKKLKPIVERMADFDTPLKDDLLGILYCTLMASSVLGFAYALKQILNSLLK